MTPLQNVSNLHEIRNEFRQLMAGPNVVAYEDDAEKLLCLESSQGFFEAGLDKVAGEEYCKVSFPDSSEFTMIWDIADPDTIRVERINADEIPFPMRNIHE